MQIRPDNHHQQGDLAVSGSVSANPSQDGESASNVSPIPVVTMAELKTLLYLSPDPLVIVDQTGIIVLINEQMTALFGYQQEDLVGQSLEVLLPERFRTAHIAHRTSYGNAPRLRQMGAGLDLVGRRKDGGEFPVDISLRPLVLEEVLHVVGAIRDVSTQRRLERERAQQAQQLQQQATLLNLAHDAIFVRDPINRLLSWNRGAEELYGWTSQEALGRVAHTLLKTRFPQSQAALDAQLEAEGRWEGTLVHTRRDDQFVVESRQVVVRDAQGHPTAILEIDRDITERQRLEQKQSTIHAETLARRTFLEQVLDALPSSVAVVHGTDARLILANRAAASIWGAIWTPGQSMKAFLQEHHIRIVDERGRPFPPEEWATMRALLQGETVLQHQEVIRQPAGISLPILVNAVPLFSPHWQSLGEQESLESGPSVQDHEPLALVIHQDVRSLKEAEYRKDEFIGIAAHELRQPLAVLKGTVGTLVLQTARGHGPELAPWQQEMLQELEQATARLADMTEDLLDVSRLQAGQLSLQRASTNLVSLVRRTVERFQQRTTLHHLQWHTSQTIVAAFIDSQRIEQVLSNLLANAMKYSPEGGPIEVTLDIDCVAQMAEIQVKDGGIGIPRHQQKLIFGRFIRADNAHAAGISGTGLGLYLCRALVEQHEGQIWFESEEGKGTTFFFTLPLLQVPAE